MGGKTNKSGEHSAIVNTNEEDLDDRDDSGAFNDHRMEQPIIQEDAGFGDSNAVKRVRKN